MDHSLSLFWLAFLFFLPSFLPPNWSPTNLSITVATKLFGGSGEGYDGRTWAGLGASPKDHALLGLDPHGVRWGTERSPLHNTHWGVPQGTASSCHVPQLISVTQGASPWELQG